MNNIAVNVQSLKKYYGETKAVDDVSFQLIEGELLAILGPNGAGKTTTMELLEGLRKPDSGKVSFFAEALSPTDRRVKEQIGVQLQSSSFFRFLTVRETLELFRGLYTHKVSTMDLISELALEEKEKTLVKNLSGGQLQRLAVAVALVNDPRVVFLDEPTTGLDPQARRMQWETVLKLKNKGKTIILTTHYMEEAEYLADRIIIMDHGKIVACGTLEELISSIAAENIVNFRIKSTTPLPKELESMPGLKVQENQVYSLTTPDVSQDLTKLFELAAQHSLRLDDVSIRRPNLDDVFIQITGRQLRD